MNAYQIKIWEKMLFKVTSETMPWILRAMLKCHLWIMSSFVKSKYSFWTQHGLFMLIVNSVC